MKDFSHNGHNGYKGIVDAGVSPADWLNSLARALQRLAIIVFMSSVNPRKRSGVVDRLESPAVASHPLRLRKTMAVDSPKAQISNGKAAMISQHVEDNAFHLEGRELASS